MVVRLFLRRVQGMCITQQQVLSSKVPMLLRRSYSVIEEIELKFLSIP